MGYEQLPHLNAALNLASFIFLLLGWRAIRRKEKERHARWMLSAFGSSTLFLISYLAYHFHVLTKRFPGTGLLRTTYLVILFTHVVLAAVVLPLAIATLTLALRGRLERHRRLARWTLPIWLYVSVTGVIVYVMLYWVARWVGAEGR